MLLQICGGGGHQRLLSPIKRDQWTMEMALRLSGRDFRTTWD
jgi:hypothetical protein